MKQPEFGTRVAEMRQQKGLTQEQLAEFCEVSARTIQRIESGEVEPRPFTRNSISNCLEFDFNGSQEKNETFWLSVLHLSGILCMVAVPLLIWSWKKKTSYKIDQQGRDVMNFQITMTMFLMLAAFLLIFVMPAGILVMEEIGGGAGDWAGIAAIGTVLPLIVIGLFTAYQSVVNTMRVLSDKPYHYRLSIPFVR
ncbi:MAG: helix-turn-helix domain-containing protein [Anaerolineaceae bacterium]|nr:helix-turn-helix domain-containing protein [Anaerolineaceae bacterium]